MLVRKNKLLLILCVCLSLVACDAPEQRLRVGLLVWPAYEFPFIARQLGRLPENEIQLLDYQSPAEVLRAYKIGALDVVAMTVDYFIELSEESADHAIVYVIDYSQGGDAVLMSPDVKPDSTKVRIAYEPSALGVYMLSRFIAISGYDKDALNFVPVDIPNQPQAYRDGLIDAAVTYEPYRSQLISAGMRELFSSKEIPGEIIDVLITRKSVIEDNSNQLKKLVVEWMSAHEYTKTNPRLAHEIMAVREKMKPKEFAAALKTLHIVSLEENHKMLSGANGIMMGILTRHAQVMHDFGFINTIPKITPEQITTAILPSHVTNF